MDDRTYSWVFGPVPSRRLGRSLGIDLVPFKTCSYDCIYCQLGRTTNKTIEKKEYAPLLDVLAEVYRKIDEGVQLDYITLSGSGEPTLYSKIDDLILAIKEKTNIPLAILTNGSLLWDIKVREALQDADLVIPSLDAGDSTVFGRVNRPHAKISFENMLEGLVEFRNGFSGQLWLELFLVGGITGIASEFEKLLPSINRIQPDRIQLNTVIRPPAEEIAIPVSEDLMHRFAQILGNKAEVIADFDHVHEQMDFKASRETILNLLRRRPCSLMEIVQGLGVHPSEVLKYLDDLLGDGIITALARNGSTFYRVNANRA